MVSPPEIDPKEPQMDLFLKASQHLATALIEDDSARTYDCPNAADQFYRRMALDSAEAHRAAAKKDIAYLANEKGDPVAVVTALADSTAAHLLRQGWQPSYGFLVSVEG